MAAPIEAGLTNLTEAKTLTIWDFGNLNEILWVKHEKELKAQKEAESKSSDSPTYYNSGRV